MKTMQNWLDAYAEHHQNPTNKLIHWLCVPTIMFTLIGLFTAIPSGFISGWLPAAMQPYFNWATIFVVAASTFYLRLSVPMFIGFLPVMAAMIWGNVQIQQAAFMPLWAFSLLVFAIAWVGQFIGHKIEGAKPSFLDDVKFLLIGPAWLMSFIFQKLGLKY